MASHVSTSAPQAKFVSSSLELRETPTAKWKNLTIDDYQAMLGAAIVLSIVAIAAYDVVRYLL